MSIRPAAGTVVGAVVGLVAAGTPVGGGCLGFALAAVALRFHPAPPRARPSAVDQ